MDPKLILKEADKYWEEVRDIRRTLHQNPELSFKEFETSKFIQDKLTAWEVPYSNGWVKTGIVAELEGDLGGSTLTALRADMDALPIVEDSNAPYKSKNDGLMHACGHDAHSSMLLGALKILSENKAHWGGKIRAVFQPGEELLPGGASLMLKEGALDNPKPSSIFGQHVYPELPAGKVGFRPGMYMASTDELYFTIKGKGGHGAMPHKCIDPIWISSQVITALQQISSRLAPPDLPTVLSIGRIEGLGATNVIPSEVKMQGTFRTFDEGWREQAHEHIDRIASGVCKSLGGELELEIRRGYPVLYNDEVLTARAQSLAIELLGKENVTDLSLRPTAEDFAYYTQHMPGCFYRLGTASPKGGKEYPVHHPKFDIDEASLKTGMAMMAWLGVSMGT